MLALAGVTVVEGIPAEAASEMEQRVRAEMKRRHIPGLAVTVVRDGQRVWTGVFGMADLENNVSVTERTVFRFASVSKAITAVAALQLVESGRMRLESRVDQILGSESGVPVAPITVRHLLAHQSGLRHYQPRTSRDPMTHYNRLTDVLHAKAGDPVLFAPGNKFGYTTHGYVVLGRAMEVVGGTEFGELMRVGVFATAGMTTARVDDFYALIPHRAQGYFRSLNGEMRNSEPSDLSDKIPGGGLCGTIGDLGAFVVALQHNTLLSPETLALVWKPQMLADGSSTGYGLGWYVGVHEGQREVRHPGSQSRVSSLIWLAPDAGVAVAILANMEQVNFLSLARRLGEIAR